jgi:CheY-like chemotaxis protein
MMVSLLLRSSLFHIMPSRAKSVSSKRSRILFVDAHRAGVKARCMVLEELGHRATGVSSPDEAMQLLATEKFDLIVTEFKLAGTTGTEFIARLREITMQTPVILLSGFVDALGLSEQSTGADAVLMKCASETNLLAYTVNRLLRAKVTARPAKKPSVAAAPVAPPATRKNGTF